MKMLRAISDIFIHFVSYLSILEEPSPFACGRGLESLLHSKTSREVPVKLLFVILPDDKVTLVLGIFLVILLDTLSLLMMIWVKP